MKPRKTTLTQRTRLAPERESKSKDNAPVRPAVPDGQAMPRPSLPPSPAAGFLPTSRWGIEELKAVLADAAAEPMTSKPTDAPAALRLVRFDLLAPNVREIFLVGSFNDWNSTATPMTRSSEVRWAKELSLPPGRYEYRFLVDGRWKEDPKARDYAPNPFGGFNSVLRVE